MSAYYNEFDPFAAQWLRNLIARDLIAPGDVDERSIVEIQPDDVRGYAQAHFFAGIGVWSHALRLAGWPDERPVWTGSCPCQPFSAAGRGDGFDDERHLWPVWERLIAECRPAAILGEQVASKAAEPWLDLVQSDLEGLGYAVGAVPIPAAGIGAPHIRDRLWWVADAADGRRDDRGDERAGRHGGALLGAAGGICAGLLALPAGAGPQGRAEPWQRADAQRAAAERDGRAGGVADAERFGRERGRPGETGDGRGPEAQPAASRLREAGGERPGPLHGFWRDADWLLCRDGKWRPVEPGTFPLAHGAPARVGRLRAYGNAIVAPLAAQFIAAVMECRP